MRESPWVKKKFERWFQKTIKFPKLTKLNTTFMHFTECKL